MTKLNTKTILICAAAMTVALSAPLLAVGVAANTRSDQGGDDYCADAVDPSGAASPPPTTQFGNDWCDANSANTAVTSVGSGGGGCQDDPHGHGAASDTICHGGAVSFADTSFGAGNFGGDYPIATEVTFTNTGAPARYAFSVDYVDTTNGVTASTALTAARCIANGGKFSIDVTGSDEAGSSDLLVPTGTTIDRVDVTRIFVTAGWLSCGNGDAATRVLTFRWDYEAITATGTSATTLATATCATGAWAAAVSNTGTAYGEAQVSLYDINNGVYDNMVNGWFEDHSGSGADASASDVTTGVLLQSGHTYDVVGNVWAIGETYVVTELAGGSVTCF